MDKRWIKAATILQPSAEVCGIRLLPFCLRHRVALEAINSPVLEPGKPMTAKHLVAAARILSSKSLSDVVRPATLRDKFWVSRLTFSEKLLVLEIHKLVAYLNEQAFWPRFWEKGEGTDNKTSKSGIPWQLAVVASLTRNGCTLEEAWTMPEAEAIWLHIAHSTALGADVSVMSDHEWDAIQKYKREKNNQTPSN
jgi:hypothetical protein